MSSQWKDVEGLFQRLHVDNACLHDLQMIEGSLEVKLPTIWTDEAAEMGRGREEKVSEEKKSEEKE